MNIYEAFKTLGWRPYVRHNAVFFASFGRFLFVGGFRGYHRKRSRDSVISSAKRDLESGKAEWLEKTTKGFYKSAAALKDVKFSSTAEMALKLTAMGICG